MQVGKTLYVKDRIEWRAWLEEHHATEEQIWLIFYKKASGEPRIPYDDAVEEALCFGWIDSLIKKLDDKRYCQLFTPRRPKSKWSSLNKKRVAKLIREGKMTEAGLAKLDRAAMEKSAADGEPERKKKIATPPFFRLALEQNAKARENFEKLAPSARRLYLLWIKDAKRDETRARRVKEAIRLLEQNKKLGMK
jgi:uncharacterized protein YdeI (YjbR/CyaY-like superfamily)